jgi:hypothetical protein
VKPVPGMVNIACYHGPVKGARTESDWQIDEGMSIEFFKDYDFVMLGDIHTFQYLGYRDVEIEIDEQDLCRYVGCTVVGNV